MATGKKAGSTAGKVLGDGKATPAERSKGAEVLVRRQPDVKPPTPRESSAAGKDLPKPGVPKRDDTLNASLLGQTPDKPKPKPKPKK